MPKGMVTLSSKNQITVPAAIVRALGLKPGEKLFLKLEDGKVVLQPCPTSLTKYFSGIFEGYYGKTKGEVDTYLAEVRGDWGTVGD